jgi:ribonucleotide reductase alpha subunit
MATAIETTQPNNFFNDDEMYVTKRNGNLEIVAFDKILNRIKKIGLEVNIKINYTTLTMKVIDQLYNKISTTKIDEISAEQCASMASIHPDYNVLAGRIIVSNHQKNTKASFSEVMTDLYNYRDKHDKHSPLVSQELYDLVQTNGAVYDQLCDYSRDYLIDYFGFKTLERSYLMKINKKSMERIQHMWLRVAIGIHSGNTPRVIETYNLMSQKYFTHATPTLFNAGTPQPQLSSCFLQAMESDSIDGIFNTLKDCALISKWSGGIGLHIHNVRATGSHIRGTNGTSNGLIPMLRVFNNAARYVDQCVHPETIIYTTQGPKQIQHCIAGETEIYNLNGETEVIQNVLEHSYNGDILEIDTMHSITPLQITPEHPVYVARGIDTPLEFDWVDAKDLTTEDWVAFPIPTQHQDSKTISEDDCYAYGIFLKYAIISNYSTTQNDYIIMYSTSNQKSIIDFIINYFNKKCVEHKVYNNDDITTINWVRSIHLPFRYSDFYNENKKKRIQSKWLNLPPNKSKYILKGLLDIDTLSNGEYLFNSGSNELIETVRFLVTKMGILPSITNEKKITIPKTLDICLLLDTVFDENTRKTSFIRHDNLLLSRIKNIKKTIHSGVLYDLQMEKQHDYLLHNGLVHNGGGKRNGSFAIYLEPWHADIELFLQMRKNHGDEEMKARDLFYALWIPDLFMERVKSGGTWTLMCPDECPGLSDVYGEEFEKLYTYYEEENKGRKTMNARDLWFQVLDSQMETGTPYILYKDAANKKSNQKNLGTIKSSNLCVAPETLILTDQGEKVIKELEGQTVNVWNGEEFSSVVVRKTGENQELIQVHTSEGNILDCTPYHKFYIQSDDVVIMKEAQNLVNGDIIISYKVPNFKYVNYDLVSKGFIYKKNVSIEKVVITGRIDDTYCFTEPKKHMGVFNGILTGQCTEIIEYSSPDETAVCNLASIALPSFVNKTTTPPSFDYDKLHEISRVVTFNLNRVIDVNFYPTEKTKNSNFRHRPIGIGVQGLADVFMMMDVPFHSDEAKDINSKIFETIYHGALEETCEIAQKEGTYETFAGSPASQGILQFDMWDFKPSNDRYDWDLMKEQVKRGIRNSLLLAPMPTASTSQILGFNECIEPITSNIYSRKTIAGDFILANKYLMNDLIQLDLWNEKIKNNIIANNGSIQQIDIIPEKLRDKYKTVWEIPMKHLIDMSADRGVFICQSQSLNLWLEQPTYNSLTSMFFYGWQKGLKTGIYYLRRRARHQAQQFTIEVENKVNNNHILEEDSTNGCESCSS